MVTLSSTLSPHSHFFYSIGCIFGELLVKDAILKGNGELDVSNCNSINDEMMSSFAFFP